MAKTKSQSHQPQQKKKSPLAFIALAAVLGAIAVFAFTRGNSPEEERSKSEASQTAQTPLNAPSVNEQQQQQQQAPKVEESGFRMPPYFENPDSAGTLGATLDPAAVQPYAKAGYLVAKQKPRLLAQLPCFCYCDRFGHASLQTCFQTNHAEQCEVCLSEAVEADQLDRQGMTPADIRTAIVEKHHPRSHEHS
jgi:hypothetical protein